MAVSSCESYDETASWRSKDNVINMTKSASSAGDIFSNNRLDENCNNNNNSKASHFVNTSNECTTQLHVASLALQSEDQEKKSLIVHNSQNLNDCSETDLEQHKVVENIDYKRTIALENSRDSSSSSQNMKWEVNCDLKNIKDINENISKVVGDIEVNETFDGLESKSSNSPTQENVNEGASASPKNESISEEDKQSISLDDAVIRDPEWTEERFRVDRRKLEQMLQAAANGTGQTGEDFFSKIMSETDTQITWPSKLKIGAKSKKDPHIKVSGKQANVRQAKAMVMQVLDTKCTRVTLKMDVSHTEHSHVIGKGGNNIKRVMEETGCHIHFPDSNRNGTAEKSNQVSIAGQPAGVENARFKIRELLPIVIAFDLSMSGAIPDPNSPPIQHIVQTYNISVQFKQRVKVYCTTTCTVRGSNDNVPGLVEGTMKLMQHLTSGQVVRVTSQMEVAPQQHLYMLGRNGCNVKLIMQGTGAQISFPDPSCTPKRSTIYITGTVEQVVVARQRLMGCLPLVLMFDMKQCEDSTVNETNQNNQLMESLDVFISIKLKPKQPSKSVIVKSVEKNIFNMFEARRQLLNLPSTGLKTPSSSPPLSISTTSSVPATPMIRLSHAPSPHVKPQYIGILQPNGVALVNGPMNSISRTATPSGTAVLRPNWPHSPVPSPSQSPFPASTQATVAALQAHQAHQQSMILQLQQQQMAAAIASSNNSLAGSPPMNQKPEDVASVQQVAKQFIHENNMARRDNQLVNGNLNDFSAANQLLGNSNGMGDYPDNWPASAGSESSSLFQDKQDISANVRSLSLQVMAVQKNQMGRISANSSFNLGNSDKRLTHSHSFSDSTIRTDEFPSVDHQRRSLVEGVDAIPKNYLQVTSGRRGPMSLHSSPPGSDRNSPMSDRISDYQVISPESEIMKTVGKMKSPSSSASSSDLQSTLRNLQNSSNRNQFLSDNRVIEQHQLGMMENSFMSSLSDKREQSEHREDCFKRNSPAPPPGFEKLPHSTVVETNYETLRKKALEAMQKGPVASEVRTPTGIWYGQGFSRSMPNHEWNRLQINKKFKNPLEPNYEREDSALHEDAESCDVIPFTTSQHLANSSKGGSALSAWREKNSHNLSAHSKDFGNSLPRRRQHSTFDPRPVEYMNQSHPPPPHPNDDTNSLSFNKDHDVVSRHQRISNQPLEAALSLLTNNHLGGQSNCVELHDLLSHLNLEKYSEVFTKQEVDLQTFLTLTESDLTELGIKTFGPRRKILLAIEELKKNRNVLYGSSLSAAPGGPSHLRPPQSNTDNIGGFLSNAAKSSSPPLQTRVNNPHHPASRLLHNGRGIVSQSGRW